MRARPLIAAAVVLLALAPAAHAATFGPDLNSLPANNDPATSCGQAPNYYTPAAGSCMYSYFQLGSTTNTLEPNQSGTVSQIRVKVGNTTGPMRVNVIRGLFRQTGDTAHPALAGPFLEAYGPQFTPGANAITAVNTNLALREDNTPPVSDTSTIQVIDSLALEVLAPNVPVPLFGSPNSLTTAIYPGPTASGTPAPSPNAMPNYTNQNIGVLMNADINAAGGAPGTGAPVPGGGALPSLGLRSRTAKVKHGVASLPITCQGADCAGLVSLRKPAKAAATAKKKRKKKPKTVSYGSKRFGVKAGKKATVKVKLNKAGRKLLKHHKKAKVAARVSFSKGGGKTTTVSITLKR